MSDTSALKLGQRPYLPKVMSLLNKSVLWEAVWTPLSSLLCKCGQPGSWDPQLAWGRASARQVGLDEERETQSSWHDSLECNFCKMGLEAEKQQPPASSGVKPQPQTLVSGEMERLAARTVGRTSKTWTWWGGQWNRVGLTPQLFTVFIEIL